MPFNSQFKCGKSDVGRISKPYHYVCRKCAQVFHTPQNPPTRIALFAPLEPEHTIAEYCPTCAPSIIEAIKDATAQNIATHGEVTE